MAHFRSTPSHGFLYLSPKELAAIPDFARRQSYEEDCEWSIAVVALPAITATAAFDHQADKAKILDDARSTCRNYYPDIFARLTGETPTPANSRKLADEQFDRDNAENYVVISASGDWKAGVPAGYVECIATKGGGRGRFEGNTLIQPPELVFFVLADRYHTRRQNGYVIRPDELDHPVTQPETVAA